MSKRTHMLVRTAALSALLGVAVVSEGSAHAPSVGVLRGCNSVYCEAGTVCPGESFLEGWCTVSAGCPNSTPGCAENFGICNPGLAIRCNVFQQ